MDVTCPAKINLYLEVIRKRSDGYHEIDTLFEKISIFDKLSVSEKEPPTEINCNSSLVPTDKDCLLQRTVSKFKERSQNNTDFKITLEKHIPIGAGLGGGSSNAAGLLKAMNHVTGDALTGDELVNIAKELGADVPFFLYDYSFARGRGIGGNIEKIDFPGKIWHIVVKPPFSTSTHDIYNSISSFGLTKDRHVDRMMTAFSKEKAVDSIARNLRNDLQRIVLREFPVIEEIFTRLREEGAIGVLVSGSGSCVFGIFTEEKVKKAQENLEKVFLYKEDWRVFAARTF